MKKKINVRCFNDKNFYQKKKKKKKKKHYIYVKPFKELKIIVYVSLFQAVF